MGTYDTVKWKENGKLKLLIIVGTRPEIIRLAAVINKTRPLFKGSIRMFPERISRKIDGI